MRSVNEIKNSIKSISDTNEITKAMQLISVAKRRRAVQKCETHKRYQSIIKQTIIDILEHRPITEHSFFTKRTGKRIAYLVVTSDKGLCADFNNKILNVAYQDMQGADEKFVFTIGHVAQEFFKSKDVTVDVEYLHIIADPTLDDARKIMYNIVELWNNNFFDEVRIAYSLLVSSENKAHVSTLLPIEITGIEQEYELERKLFGGEAIVHNERAEYMQNEIAIGAYNYIYEGLSNDTVTMVLEQYLLGEIYSSLILSVAAEHFARMMAMDNASRNGQKRIDELSIEFNKLRQEKITTELVESAGGKINANKA